jgi:uncharacterized Zn finger protein
MREDAPSKALRLLAEGRISILQVSDSRVLAMCRGDSAAAYWVEWAGGRWTCTCPAIGRCSHALAVQRVVVTEGLQMPLEPSYA